MTGEGEKKVWWRFKRPKPNLKIEELEAKLRKAERDREAKQAKRQGESER